LRFYIASFVGERTATQELQSAVVEAGHEITVDWTSFPSAPDDGDRNSRPDDVAEIAIRDLRGIQSADVFVLQAGVPEGRGKYTELGFAIALSEEKGSPRVFVVGNKPDHSIFFFHPAVHRVRSIQEALESLGRED